MCKILHNGLKEIIVFYTYQKNNKIIEEKINTVKSKNIEYNLDKINKDKYLSYLEKYQEQEFKRKNIIENKSKSFLFVISLYSSLILSILSFILKDNLHWISLLVLIASMISLILCAISLISAINIKGYYIIDAFKKYNITRCSENLNENIISRTPIEMTKKDLITEMHRNIELNEFILIQKTNALDSAFKMLILSIILLSLFLISAILIKNYDNILKFIFSIGNYFH